MYDIFVSNLLSPEWAASSFLMSLSHVGKPGIPFGNVLKTCRKERNSIPENGNDMENILMINYEYPPLGGGGGVFNKHLAEVLARRYNVTVITSKFGEQPALEVVNNVQLLRVPIPLRSDPNAAGLVSMLSFFPSSLWAGIRLLGRVHFDIMHSMFAVPSAPSGVLLAKLYGKPHLLSILGGDIYDPSKKLSPHRTPLLGHATATVMRNSHAVVSLSRDIQQRAHKHYRVEKDIDVIHLGIPKPTYRPLHRADFGLADDDILLMTVGRLVKRKAVHELLEAVAHLDNPRVKLLIIGDGPQSRKLQQDASDLAIDRQVLFLGNVDDETKFGMMGLSNIFVSASSHEGFGLVFLEAMAVGLPVISYNKGGQNEFLLDDLTGALVPSGNSEQLFEKIRQMVKNEQLRQHISRHNLAYVENFFIERCAQKYEEKYLSLIETAA